MSDIVALYFFLLLVYPNLISSIGSCLPTDRNGQRIPVLDWYVLFLYLTSRQGGDSAGAEVTVSMSEGPDPWTSVEFGLCLHYLCLLVLIYMDPCQRLLETNDCPCLLEASLKSIGMLETCAPTHPGLQAPCEAFQARRDVCLLLGNYSSPPKLC